MRQQLGAAQLQGLGQLVQRDQRWGDLAALDLAHLGAVQIGLRGQLLLRPAMGLAQLAHGQPEVLDKVLCGHG